MAAETAGGVDRLDPFDERSASVRTHHNGHQTILTIETGHADAVVALEAGRIPTERKEQLAREVLDAAEAATMPGGERDAE